MEPKWCLRKTPQARPANKTRALVLVAAFLVSAFAVPLGGAQESGGGGGGPGPDPEPPAEANNTTSPPLPDLTVLSFRQVDHDQPCCPTPPAPEPCCEPTEPTPEEPEPMECCDNDEPEPGSEPCCPHDPPEVRYVAFFEVEVANEGMAMASDVVVQVQGPDASARQVAPSLAPGERLVFWFDLDAAAGQYLVHADVDPDQLVAESDETNNGAAIDARFGPTPLPDLVAQSFWVRSDPRYGDGFLTAHVQLTNLGEAASGAFRIVVFMEGHLIESVMHRGLLVGEMTEHVFALGAPWRDATIVVHIDAYDEVPERNEWNNLLHAYHAVPRADLTVSGLQAPDLPLGGSLEAPEATARFQVENRGDAASHPVRYALLLDDEVVAEHELPFLEPGQMVDVEATIPASPGTYLLEVLVDSDDRLEERNERDNHDAAIAAFGYADLVADLDVSDPDGARYGDLGAMTVTVRNDGRFGAQPSLLEVRDGAATVAALDVDALPAGAEHRFTVPWTLAPGLHSLSVTVDAAGAIVEADEANNRAEADLDLGTPELTLDDLTWDLETPEEGRPLHILANVSYQGRLGIDAARLRLDIDGAAFDEWLLEALEPGDSFTAMSEWHPVEGDHTLTATVDPHDVWPESNETDNIRSEALHVRAPTPAVCTTAPDAQETCRRVLLGEEDPLLLDA